MKFLLVAGAAALVSAQADSTGYFPGEPSCALPCLSSAITEAGCALSDIACQCGPTQSVIAANVGGCIFASCPDPTDLGAAVNAGQAVCSSFLAGELSFTSPEGPPQTPTPVLGSSSSSSGPDTTDTSVIMTNPPFSTTTTATSGSGSGSGSGNATSSSSGGSASGSGSGITTPTATHTDTLIGPSSVVLTGSSSSPTSSTPTGGAAVPAGLGSGLLAGLLGIVAFL
ncbi:hypothetical protein F5Y09DRAFT_7403 [Xylaria sp. FL1042]|nr:hypothetical protein F5Y09DRAFT_7403 [Xylaria sp. FL1042]